MVTSLTAMTLTKCLAAGLALGLAGAAAAQDAARGETIFKRCTSCHQIGANARHRIGPILTGVVGRRAGSAQGYRYGASMQAAGAKGLVWDEAQIFAYLADPSKFLKAYLGDRKARAKMSFRLKNEQDRRDVIAYLARFSNPQRSEVCVTNGDLAVYHFTAEAADGTRVTADLAPGARLCASGGELGERAVVSVFPDPHHLEGCSRLVPMGQVETLLRYVDFDRCEWASHHQRASR